MTQRTAMGHASRQMPLETRTSRQSSRWPNRAPFVRAGGSGPRSAGVRGRGGELRRSVSARPLPIGRAAPLAVAADSELPTTSRRISTPSEGRCSITSAAVRRWAATVDASGALPWVGPDRVCDSQLDRKSPRRPRGARTCNGSDRSRALTDSTSVRNAMSNGSGAAQVVHTRTAL